MTYYDPILQAVSILEDEKLQDGFMTASVVEGVGDERIYSELNTGLWWERTQMLIPEVFFISFLY